MFSDLILRPVNAKAYNDRPFTFLDQDAQNDLANIITINLVENGDRAARENWQNRQLTNLLRHAQTRSRFWRQRLPSRMMTHGVLKYLPIQSRADVANQVKLEGSLIATDQNSAVSSYASTGSTGTPVKVYASAENGYYNFIRSLAKYFINDLSLDEPRVKIVPPTSFAMLQNDSLTVKTADSWAGSLSKVFRNGRSKAIIHQSDDDALIAELLKEPVGYLTCSSRCIDILVNAGGLDLIKKLGIKLWLHASDYRDPEHLNALNRIGIPSLSSYSASELGPIAYECAKCPGNFHVAHTNVIVERDSELTATFNNLSVDRLLITHLHSYATPLIRYDIGDFGHLEQRCPCGHDGATLSNLFGRGKNFVRLPNGTLKGFHVSTRLLQEVVSFRECRVRQPDLKTITVELSRPDDVTAEEETKLKMVIAKATDPAFVVTIKTVKEIDWSANPKRLFFSSAVA